VLPSTPAPIENRAGVVRVSVGSGTGGECAYCHKRIDPQTVEYEVDAYIPAGLRTLHFHRVCLHLWEELPSQRVMDVGTSVSAAHN
jgi:hypothetical protein